ncbi:MAG: CYTH domain-containing protein [Cypionkella sp.]
MAREIERKFLVRSDDWQAQVIRSSQITDGLLLTSGERKLRIRIRDDSATMAYKGAREGLARDEFEYAIPLADAVYLIKHQCEDRVLTKTRHDVPHLGFTWEVDVYDFPLDGIILAEVELPDEGTEVALPHWLGQEVSGLPRYRKLNLLLERLAQAAAVSPDPATRDPDTAHGVSTTQPGDADHVSAQTGLQTTPIV